MMRGLSSNCLELVRILLAWGGDVNCYFVLWFRDVLWMSFIYFCNNLCKEYLSGGSHLVQIHNALDILGHELPLLHIYNLLYVIQVHLSIELVRDCVLLLARGPQRRIGARWFWQLGNTPFWDVPLSRVIETIILSVDAAFVMEVVIVIHYWSWVLVKVIFLVLREMVQVLGDFCWVVLLGFAFIFRGVGLSLEVGVVANADWVGRVLQCVSRP